MRGGREVTRLEGFSDAVFGFALTLLVVSLEVPDSFPALKQTLSGFLPFAATFAVVSWIWFEHYLFFKDFKLEDNLTVLFNLVLLFVVLFFAYPLKFVLTRLVGGWFGISVPNELNHTGYTASDARLLMIAYSAGFVAVFAALALFYWNALRQRGALGLAPLEVFDARAGMRRHLLCVAIGTASILLALVLPMRLFGFSGFIYFLLGPVQGTNGYRTGVARARLAASLGDRPEPGAAGTAPAG
jgi:uncharacterized membrane protein